jgi:hypothetical protein
VGHCLSEATVKYKRERQDKGSPEGNISKRNVISDEPLFSFELSVHDFYIVLDFFNSVIVSLSVKSETKGVVSDPSAVRPDS